MREIYNKNLQKFSTYVNMTEEQMRRQDEKDEWGDDSWHPIICKDCGEDIDDCDCDLSSGEKW
jgi:hypothetical protein